MPARDDGLAKFFMFACGSTWLLATPAAFAWLNHQAPSPFAVACAGFSAFGPLIAAFVVARPRGRLREVFGHLRAELHWVGLALLTPPLIHLVSTLLYVALGGHVTAWVHPPLTAQQLAALVVLPLGEEFGWRGFAHAPMVRRFGAVRGSLLLGLGWGVWHLAYAVTPELGSFDWLLFSRTLVTLPLYSVVIAWIFERAQRGMAVALAVHAGAHLDNVARIPRDALGLHELHIAVVAFFALLAARALAKTRPSPDLRADPVARM